MLCIKTLCILVTIITLQNPICSGQYVEPKITLEALEPKGFRASIPDSPGTQLFGFHGNLNQRIGEMELGEFYQDITRPQNGLWLYNNPDLALKPGDVINYWTIIQHNKTLHRKDAQTWEVKEVGAQVKTGCDGSKTVRAGVSTVCAGSVLMAEEFDGSLDASRWLQEQYIPNNGPDYEFCYYTKDKNIVYLNQGSLYIKPEVAAEETLRETLNLKQGCTRLVKNECYSTYNFFPQQPIASGRISSELKFQYAKIDIRAKLPAGDWLYPQIYLEDVLDSNKKIWIAYARGNEKLTDNDGGDIGGRLLFAGPVLYPMEPDRSKKLVSVRSNVALSKEFHTYSLEWTPDHIKFYLDNIEYGTVSKANMAELNLREGRMFRLVLGVAAGGNNDFPDYFKSNGIEKPWINFERNLIWNFYRAKSQWLPTWQGDNTALKVEYVKIWAI